MPASSARDSSPEEGELGTDPGTSRAQTPQGRETNGGARVDRKDADRRRRRAGTDMDDEGDYCSDRSSRSNHKRRRRHRDQPVNIPSDPDSQMSAAQDRLDGPSENGIKIKEEAHIEVKEEEREVLDESVPNKALAWSQSPAQAKVETSSLTPSKLNGTWSPAKVWKAGDTASTVAPEEMAKGDVDQETLNVKDAESRHIEAAVQEGDSPVAPEPISDGWPQLDVRLKSTFEGLWHANMELCKGAYYDHKEKHHRPKLRQKRHQRRPTFEEFRLWIGCSDIDLYDVSVQLGEGTFGVVMKGKNRVSGREVALKKITVHDSKDGIALTTVREVKLLKALRHPAIVPVIDMVYRPALGGSEDQGEIYMVEPYMDHDLAGLLDHVNLTVPQIKLYMKQLFSGTEYLHRNNIIHRDIKSANLLINNEGQLQIADFGLARSIKNMDYAPGPAGSLEKTEYTGTVVTRWYRPPELLAGLRTYGPAIDMWGLGCILIEMFYKKPFFMGTSEINQLELIARQCGSPSDETLPGWSSLPGVRNADAHGRVDESKHDGQKFFGTYPRTLYDTLTKGPVTVPRGAAELADKLLVLDPERRMTASEALDDDWLWTPPWPARPEELPQYEPRKESDRKKKEMNQAHQMSRMGADPSWNGHEPPQPYYPPVPPAPYLAPGPTAPQPLIGANFAPMRPAPGSLAQPMAGYSRPATQSTGNALSKLKY